MLWKHDSDDNENVQVYTANKIFNNNYTTVLVLAPWMFVSAIWTRQLRFHNSMKCCRVVRFEFPAMWNKTPVSSGMMVYLYLWNKKRIGPRYAGVAMTSADENLGPF